MVVGYVRQVSARCPRGKHKYTMSADSIYKVIAGSVRGALSYNSRVREVSADLGQDPLNFSKFACSFWALSASKSCNLVEEKQSGAHLLALVFHTQTALKKMMLDGLKPKNDDNLWNLGGTYNQDLCS